MSETIISTEDTKLVKGQIEVAGINIDISSILGNNIIDQYIAQLDDKAIKVIMDHISEDLFEPSSEFGHDKAPKLKYTRKSSNYYYNSNNTEFIADIVKNLFNKRIKEELLKKVDEIIASDDYQKRIEEIARDIIEYSINGYKEEMAKRICERLVGNVLDPQPNYDGKSLNEIIARIASSYIVHPANEYQPE